MTRYRMSDGTIVDSDNASASWDEATRNDGHHPVSVATGSHWAHERLNRSRRGRYYVERWHQANGTVPGAEWVSNEEATRWLLLSNYDPSDADWPAELTPLVDEVSE